MEWGYGGDFGPENWHRKYLAAGGMRQSPVNIESQKMRMSHRYSNSKLQFRHRGNNLKLLCNQGYTWEVSAKQKVLEIIGGPLESEYELEQIHAHWGNDNCKGSEHTIDGLQYAAELHMVFWNKKHYSSITEAKNHPDGLCVLAVLLKLGKENEELQKVVEKIPKILHFNDHCDLNKPINLKKLFPKHLSYWSYMGSLTTPPCLECVIWIIFHDPIEISAEQLDVFRTLRAHSAEDCTKYDICGDRLLRNCRPTFPIGERIILRSTTDL